MSALVVLGGQELLGGECSCEYRVDEFTGIEQGAEIGEATLLGSQRETAVNRRVVGLCIAITHTRETGKYTHTQTHTHTYTYTHTHTQREREIPLCICEVGLSSASCQRDLPHALPDRADGVQRLPHLAPHVLHGLHGGEEVCAAQSDLSEQVGLHFGQLP
jgi:hypothetical protein